MVLSVGNCEDSEFCENLPETESRGVQNVHPKISPNQKSEIDLGGKELRELEINQVHERRHLTPKDETNSRLKDSEKKTDVPKITYANVLCSTNKQNQTRANKVFRPYTRQGLRTTR